MLVVWWSGSRKSPAMQGSSVLDRLRGGRVQRVTTTEPGASLPPESEELVDLLCARLDERAERIESLLADAKTTIARLEALQAAPVPEPPRRSRPARTEREPPLVEVAPASSKSAPSDPLCASVYSLADSGADAVAIAKQLDEHIGKVQLILALRGG